jgi:DNA invertase Pin-like site-specific DNA recombinase
MTNNNEHSVLDALHQADNQKLKFKGAEATARPWKSASIYRRVSTDKQDDSLELQERRTLDYAHMKGLEVDDSSVFSDPDTSGGIPIRERMGGKLLIAHLRSAGIKHIIVSKLDRIGRNLRDGIGFLDFCKEQDIVVHIVDLGGDSISTQGHMGRMPTT